jgi:hypothetical protein
MSIHSHEREYDKPGGWITRCACGWQGTHDQSVTLAEAQYRTHIEESLGGDAYYSAPVACRNCGSEHEQGVLLGTHVTSNPCARCGTTMLNPNNEAWHDSKVRWL